MATNKKKGLQSFSFVNPPVISSWASIVGPKEGEGPWFSDYDWILEDYSFGEDSYEKAESKMLREAIKLALNKKELKPFDAEIMLAGDCLNQLTSSNYSARDLEIPFMGLYSASATMVQTLINGSILIDGEYCERVVVASGSHYYANEKQFSHPSEQSFKRNPTSHWTTTGAGSMVLESSGTGSRITAVTVGKVVDMGQKNIDDLGSAMAPAAVETINIHLADMGRSPDYYDLILTGDLGEFGMIIAKQLFVKYGLFPEPNYSDCGVLMYRNTQDIEAGGTGCGCSSVMLCGPIMRKIACGEINKLLFVGTGILTSPLMYEQGETIPAIAHAVAIENN